MINWKPVTAATAIPRYLCTVYFPVQGALHQTHNLGPYGISQSPIDSTAGTDKVTRVTARTRPDDQAEHEPHSRADNDESLAPHMPSHRNGRELPFGIAPKPSNQNANRGTPAPPRLVTKTCWPYALHKLIIDLAVATRLHSPGRNHRVYVHNLLPICIGFHMSTL